jgi:hypothetical protein
MARLYAYLPPDVAQWLSQYPPWLVAIGAVVAVLAAVWLLGKLLKLTLYAVLIVLLVGVAAAGCWMLYNAMHGLPPPALPHP